LNQSGAHAEVVEIFERGAVEHSPDNVAQYVTALVHTGRLSGHEVSRTLAEGLRATHGPAAARGAGAGAAGAGAARPEGFLGRLFGFPAAQASRGARAGGGPAAPPAAAFGAAAAPGVGSRANPVVVQMAEPTFGTTAWRTLRSMAGFVLVLSFVSVLIDERAGGGVPQGMMQNPDLQPRGPGAVKFDDVKGVDEAKGELEEIVDYLRDPGKFTRLGGRLPKGVLLVGPPGTGKTMLARAIAGEAGVPFFYASGSEFEEMFVGVGARRVRDLFSAARKAAPCIVFLDEIDAVGGRRNPKDQQYARMTLNQLLVELDGFKASEGIIVVAATNTPDTLDRALVRPGRFDRNIHVPLPDVKGRKEILDVYAGKVKLAPGTDLTVLARGTSGMSGADLANVVNVGALKAARDGREAVTAGDLEYAKERIRFGSERRSAVIPEDQKRLVAFHEGGHALVGLFTDGAPALHKASIIPRGPAGGMTMFLPDDSRTMATRKQLLAQLDMMMGGRVAEEMAFGESEVTTGAWDDLRKATQMAQAMVTQYGFSERLGNMNLGTNPEAYMALSDHDKQIIDQETRALVNGAYERAKRLLTRHRKDLEALAEALVDKETLDADQIRAICGLEAKKVSLTD